MKMLVFVLFISFVSIAFGDVSERIIGGEPADIKDVPYHAAVLLAWGDNDDFVFGCSGAIVSEKVVVTIAQCIMTKPKRMMVSVGSADYEDGTQLVNVSKAIEHDYVNANFDYDIGVLYLVEALVLDEVTVATVSLPNSDLNVISGNALASGWGRIQESGIESQTLNKVIMPVVDHGVCEAFYAGYRLVTSRMLCAGNYATGGHAPCGKDIGGPLVSKDGLIGLFSWSFGCAKPNYPAVFVNIPKVVDWIKDMMSKA